MTWIYTSSAIPPHSRCQIVLGFDFIIRAQHCQWTPVSKHMPWRATFPFFSLRLTCCWNKWANRRDSVCGGWRSHGEVELFNDRNSWLIRQVQWKVINPGKSTAAMRAVHFNLIRNQEFKGSSPFKPCPWYTPPPFSPFPFFLTQGLQSLETCLLCSRI